MNKHTDDHYEVGYDDDDDTYKRVYDDHDVYTSIQTKRSIRETLPVTQLPPQTQCKVPYIDDNHIAPWTGPLAKRGVIATIQG